MTISPETVAQIFIPISNYSNTNSTAENLITSICFVLSKSSANLVWARSHYLCNQTEFSAGCGSLLVTTCETYQPPPRNRGTHSMMCSVGDPSLYREPSNCELIDTRWKTVYSNRRQMEIGLDFVHVVLRYMLFCYYICIRFSLKSLVSIYSFQMWVQ